MFVPFSADFYTSFISLLIAFSCGFTILGLVLLSRFKVEIHMSKLPELLNRSREFESRHIGPKASQMSEMLSYLGFESEDGLMSKTVPDTIKDSSPMGLLEALPENQAIAELKAISEKNELRRNYIGCGYYGTITPEPIKRHILENPGWYTQYTPYQAEIAQGRLEALINFQTICAELTGLEISNASLLDEATAAAEAMVMSSGAANRKGDKFYFVDENCHPQTLGLIKTRADGLGLKTIVGSYKDFDFKQQPLFGAVIQYPNTSGLAEDVSEFVAKVKEQGGISAFACDLLALTKLKTPAELGAEIAFGSSQRFGVPLGYGGPHAAFFLYYR